jgi:hypothetical protein
MKKEAMVFAARRRLEADNLVWTVEAADGEWRVRGVDADVGVAFGDRWSAIECAHMLASMIPPGIVRIETQDGRLEDLWLHTQRGSLRRVGP